MKGVDLRVVLPGVHRIVIGPSFTHGGLINIFFGSRGTHHTSKTISHRRGLKPPGYLATPVQTGWITGYIRCRFVARWLTTGRLFQVLLLICSKAERRNIFSFLRN